MRKSIKKIFDPSGFKADKEEEQKQTAKRIGEENEENQEREKLRILRKEVKVAMQRVIQGLSFTLQIDNQSVWFLPTSNMTFPQYQPVNHQVEMNKLQKMMAVIDHHQFDQHATFKHNWNTDFDLSDDQRKITHCRSGYASTDIILESDFNTSFEDIVSFHIVFDHAKQNQI